MIHLTECAMASLATAAGGVNAATRALFAVKLGQTDGEPVLVCDRLYIGSAGAAVRHATLRGHGITHILSLAEDACVPDRDAFTYFAQALEDKPGAADRFLELLPACFEFIDKAIDRASPGKVLVHCLMGKSRSAAVVCAYLMRTRRVGRNAALGILRARRAVAEPNMGFLLALKKYEKTLALEGTQGAEDGGKTPRTFGETTQFCPGSTIRPSQTNP